MAFPALASTTPPVKCRLLGQTTTFNGKLFTCIRVRSKGKTVLAWDSGKIIPTPSPTPSQSATSTPSLTPSLGKSSEPVVVKKSEIAIAKSLEVSLNSTKSFTAMNRYGNTTTYIIARNSVGILAMDATCPHNGCIVAVDSDGLLCPCHNALFDPKNGDVLRWPASYPLDRVPVREENGIIYLTN